MVHTAEPWCRYDSAASAALACGFPAGRRSLRKRKVRPDFVVVVDVFKHEPFRVAFIELDHVVEQISAAAFDPTLSDAVLPRTSEADSFGMDGEVLHCLDHFVVEL